MTMAEEQFQRHLNDIEAADLENNMEIYNGDDVDNIYTFAVGTVE